jgi:uncharacterized RDD family membrane protein YckC
LGDRLIAFALDTVFRFGVFAIVDAWVFMRGGISDGTDLKSTLTALLSAGSLNGAIFFFYFWLLEARSGTTLGKLIVGIRVVRTNEISSWLSRFAMSCASWMESVFTWWGRWSQVAPIFIADWETFAPVLW